MGLHRREPVLNQASTQNNFFKPSLMEFTSWQIRWGRLYNRLYGVASQGACSESGPGNKYKGQLGTCLVPCTRRRPAMQLFPKEPRSCSYVINAAAVTEIVKQVRAGHWQHTELLYCAAVVNTKHKTQNTRHKTQNTRNKTQDTRQKTQDI